MSTVNAAPPEAPPPLRTNRDFLLLWSGAAVSFLGTRVSGVAYPLLVLWHTGSPMAMAAVSFAALLPLLLVQLPAGALVDRWDRRRVMLACEAGRLLALASVVAALAADRFSVAHLTAVAFTEATFTVFYRLAERGAVRNVVHPAHLATALSRNEARGRAAGMLGQPGGILLQSLTRWAPFLFSAVAYLASLVTLLLIRTRFQEERTRARGKLRGEIAEGLRWLWKEPFLRAALGFVAGSNILFQALGLALVLLVKEEGQPKSVLAVIVAIGGVGGLAGALWGGWWQRRFSQRAILVGGAALWAVLITAMSFARDPLLLGALFAGTGCVGAVFNVAAAVYQVRTTPDAFQGRVAAAANLIGSGTNALGALGGGLLLTAWGASRTTLILGLVMAAMAAVVAVAPALKGEKPL
ncbi:MFS transporter [Streptomyces sp. AP-93]|uniref:MFS transporter n=1 Tax=Streptomyces sp. AP-93 TaxID=2929048 RepID=UPI001FAEBD2F|nr:MFS transporter [Streptomyces sp. AP-93]MCJ0871767.1 MFS transporter [Streptomyces sp. AP-93]